MSEPEKVHVKLGLSGTYWDKKPQYRISFDDETMAEGFITEARDTVQYIEFDAVCKNETATLKVEYLNKTPEDTKKIPDVNFVGAPATGLFKFTNDDKEIVEQQTFSSDDEALDHALVVANRTHYTTYVSFEDGRGVGHAVPTGDIEKYAHPDSFVVIDDMLLNVVSVEIDEIHLGQIPFTHSEYRTAGHDSVVKNCLNLGWNGAWTLTWTNPFYIWLLENM